MRSAVNTGAADFTSVPRTSLRRQRIMYHEMKRDAMRPSMMSLPICTYKYPLYQRAPSKDPYGIRSNTDPQGQRRQYRLHKVYQTIIFAVLDKLYDMSDFPWIKSFPWALIHVQYPNTNIWYYMKKPKNPGSCIQIAGYSRATIHVYTSTVEPNHRGVPIPRSLSCTKRKRIH